LQYGNEIDWKKMKYFIFSHFYGLGKRSTYLQPLSIMATDVDMIS
jgi:hypothetical protein